MRFLLTAALASLFVSQAQADAAAEARAALALAAAQPGAAVSEERSLPRLDYAAAHAKARSERRDLIVWIGGFVCPPCVAESQDAVHVHVPSLEGDGSPRVLVGCYCQDDGRLWCLDYLYAAGSGVIGRQRERVRATFQRPVQYQQPTYAQPSYQRAAPAYGTMPFRGGSCASCGG